MKVIASVCGQSHGCAEELRELVATVSRIDEAAKGLQIEAPAGLKPPYIESLSQRGDELAARIESAMESLEDIERASRAEIARALMGEVEEERLFLTYVARRLLASALRGSWPQRWEEGRCPICGQIPIAAKEVQKAEVTSAASSLILKCACGYEWEWGVLRCPSCGEGAPESFDVYIMGSLTVYTCKRCDHSLVVARGEVQREEWEAMPLLSYVAIEAVKSTKG